MNMKFFVTLFVFLVCLTLEGFCQDRYFVKCINDSPETCQLEVTLYNVKKKEACSVANQVAIKQLLFTGLPDSQYGSKPYVVNETESYQAHGAYYDELFNRGGCQSFLKGAKVMSEGKDDSKQPYTIVVVTINKQYLEMSLAKNNILTGMTSHPAQTIETTKPRIMVVPYIKEDEDYRTKLEEDVNMRIAVTKIKETFDDMGYNTVDLVAKLKTLSQSAAFQGENRNDLKRMVIEQSGADIYVEAEISFDWGTGKYGENSIKIIMTAYEASSGNSLSNKIAQRRSAMDDVGKMVLAALQKEEKPNVPVVKDFLYTLQDKFDDIVANGRTIVVNFGFLESSDLNMNSEVGQEGLLLKDELELWMEQNAYKNQYHIQGTTESAMIFDEVKIPVRDPINNTNFNINKFLMKLRAFIKTKLGVDFEESTNGNTLYVNFK